MWIPEVGEKVIVKSNLSRAKGVEIGDIIEVFDIKDIKNSPYITFKPKRHNTIQLLYLTDITQIEQQKITECICDIMVLMRQGCTCGFLKKE